MRPGSHRKGLGGGKELDNRPWPKGLLIWLERKGMHAYMSKVYFKHSLRPRRYKALVDTKINSLPDPQETPYSPST